MYLYVARALEAGLPSGLNVSIFFSPYKPQYTIVVSILFSIILI